MAEAFRTAMRTGRQPDGNAISPVMPFATLRELSDTDLDAMQAFLATVPPRPAGRR
jgi:hypothetical protein